MNDISSTGLQAQVVASNTYPQGFKVDMFPDDVDAINAPDIDLADTAMGPNGDMVVWSKPQGIPVEVSVIATSDDDTNMDTLGEANRIARGKTSARDQITIVLLYPNGLTVTCSKGKMTSAPPVLNATANGRYKTRTYKFMFEQITKARTA